MTDIDFDNHPAVKLRDAMARAMDPESWAEFDEGNGVCTYIAGLKVIETIKQAGLAYRALLNAGVNLPEPPTNKE